VPAINAETDYCADEVVDTLLK